MLYTNDRGQLRLSAIIGTVVGVIVLLILIFGSTGTVGAGQKGVYLRNDGVTGRVLDEGRYFKWPFFDAVVPISVQIQKSETVASSASQDLQSVTTKLAVNYQISGPNVAKIYQEFRDEIQPRIIDPAVQEAVKSATAQFTAEQLITQRAQVSDRISSNIKSKVERYGIIIKEINIVDFDFSKSFNESIEKKVTAEQDALASKNKLEQVKFEAQQKIEAAKGEAEAIKITTQSLTEQPQYLELKKIEALRISAEKGVKIVPDTVVGSGTNTLYSVGK